jgi:putative addiction module component (TIGR02574 family)
MVEAPVALGGGSILLESACRMDLQSVLSVVDFWPADDRPRLIEMVWERLADEPAAATLTEAQRQDLQRRLDVSRDNPKAGSPWEEVKARLQKRAP